MPPTVNLKDALKESLHEALDPLLSARAQKSVRDGEDNSGGDAGDISISKYLRGATKGNWSHAKKERELWDEVNDHAEKYSSDVGEEGGLLIHPLVQAQIIPLIRKKSLFRNLGVLTVDLPGTNTLEMRRQTDGASAAWIGEDENIDTAVGDDEVKLGSLDLKLKTVAGFATVPNNLIQDSSPTADRLIREDMSKVIAEKEDEAYLIGTGGKAPLGLYYWDEVADTNLDGAVTFDALIDMQTAMDEAGGEYSEWICSPRLRGALRQLKGTDGHYIWTQGDVSEREPDRLLGLPLYYSRHIPNNMGYDGTVSANRTFMVLGDFSEYLIAQKPHGISVDASTEAGNAFYRNQTVFRGIRRVDGGPRIFENFHVLKNIHLA